MRKLRKMISFILLILAMFNMVCSIILVFGTPQRGVEKFYIAILAVILLQVILIIFSLAIMIKNMDLSKENVLLIIMISIALITFAVPVQRESFPTPSGDRMVPSVLPWEEERNIYDFIIREKHWKY